MKKVTERLESFTIWIASCPEAFKDIALDATVECEFGDIVVEGREHTLAHHGPRQGDVCPCLVDVGEPLSACSDVGISHVDLDTLGGILRLGGYTTDGTIDDIFWWLAAEIDMRGYHHLDDILLEIQSDTGNFGIVKWVSRAYHAWCAWSAEHRYYPPKHSQLVDCTGFIRMACDAILRILGGDPELLEKGDKWLKAQENLDQESFVEFYEILGGNVIVRESERFVNHLYRTKHFGPADFVFARNERSGACTLSCADSQSNWDCESLMKSLFGPMSGGRRGIAGSPRGKMVSREQFQGAVKALLLTIGESSRMRRGKNGKQ
jgi:hypothetical protein